MQLNNLDRKSSVRGGISPELALKLVASDSNHLMPGSTLIYAYDFNNMDRGNINKLVHSLDAYAQHLTVGLVAPPTTSKNSKVRALLEEACKNSRVHHVVNQLSHNKQSFAISVSNFVNQRV